MMEGSLIPDMLRPSSLALTSTPLELHSNVSGRLGIWRDEIELAEGPLMAAAATAVASKMNCNIL